MKISKQWIQKDSDYIRKKVVDYNLSLLPEEVNNRPKTLAMCLETMMGKLLAGLLER
jgi:hypothetical protein